jgi:hypothetical protein
MGGIHHTKFCFSPERGKKFTLKYANFNYKAAGGRASEWIFRARAHFFLHIPRECGRVLFNKRLILFQSFRKHSQSSCASSPSFNPPFFFSTPRAHTANLILKVSLRVSLLKIISTHRKQQRSDASEPSVSSKLHYSQLNNARRRRMHAPDEGNPSISQCQHAPHVANQRCGGFGPAPVIGKLECLLVSRRNYNFASLGDAFVCGTPKVIKATSCCTDSKAEGDVF